MSADLQETYKAISAGLFKKYRSIGCAADVSPSSSNTQNDIDYFNLLQQLKLKLNTVKGRLSQHDITTWHEHTGWTNPARLVISTVKERLKPELLTQAWLKMTEILNRFPDLVTSTTADSKFRSFHLCEGPGAFVSSLNHHIHSKQLNLQWTWHGQTLNVYYEGNDPYLSIVDDRFIFETFNRWEFGADDTGNIMCRENLDDLLSKYDRHSFDLVTADGSFDCQNDPAEQESETFPLQLAETLTAFALLNRAGCFVVKKFTAFEKCSVALCFLLCRHFRSVHLFKPATSKCGNSEAYLVCQNYNPDTVDFDNLLAGNDSPDKRQSLVESLYSEAVTHSNFMKSLLEGSKFFTECQIEMIEFNLDVYALELQKQNELESFMTRLQTKTANSFLNGHYHLRRMMREHRITSRQSIPWLKCLPWTRRVGAFSDRKGVDNWRKHIQALVLKAVNQGQGDFKLLPNQLFETHLSNFGPMSLTKRFDITEMQTVFGRPLDGIFNSRFVDGNLVLLWRSLSEIAQLEHEQIQLLKFELCPVGAINEDSCRFLPLNGEGDNLEIDDTLRRSLSKSSWLDFLIRILKNQQGRPNRLDIVSAANLPMLALTRFSINVLVLLACCYSELRFQHTYNQETRIVCEHPKRGQDLSGLIRYVETLREDLSQLDRNRTLLQFLPNQIIGDYIFYDAVSKWNNAQMVNLLDVTLQQL